MALRTLAIGLLSVLLTAPALLAGPLEGRWKLVEQTYGSGAANLVRATEAPLQLEFVREDGILKGKVWSGDERARALDWPAVLSDTGAQPIEVEQVRIAPGEDRAEAHYRAGPGPNDGRVVEFVEEYRIAEDGRALVGTVNVKLTRDGEPGGSYVIHRRFERMP